MRLLATSLHLAQLNNHRIQVMPYLAGSMREVSFSTATAPVQPSSKLTGAVRLEAAVCWTWQVAI
jgi:hypothetical protein